MKDAARIPVRGQDSTGTLPMIKCSSDCDPEFKEFVSTIDLLGEKLGPLLLQFGYFNKKAFVGVNDFLARLRPFLKKLPKDHKFAVEIRNKNWLVPQFVETTTRAWRCSRPD